jgi:hypothetical protein
MAGKSKEDEERKEARGKPTWEQIDLEGIKASDYFKEAHRAGEWLLPPGRKALAWRVGEIEKKWPGLLRIVKDFFEEEVRHFFFKIQNSVAEAAESDPKIVKIDNPQKRFLAVHEQAQRVADTLYEWAFATYAPPQPKAGRPKGLANPTRDMALWSLWCQAKEGKLQWEEKLSKKKFTKERFAEMMVSTSEHRKFWGITKKLGAEQVILRRLKEYPRSRRALAGT